MARKTDPSKGGRPTVRTAEMVEAILDGISNGTPLTIVCRDQGISGWTFRRWCQDDEELAERYAGARDLGFDAIAAEILAIADDSSRDTIRTKKGAYPDKEWIERSKLRCHARLQLLAKWDPKRYGDLLKLAGADGQGAIKLNVTAEDAAL